MSIVPSVRWWWQKPVIEGTITWAEPGYWIFVRPDEDITDDNITHDPATGAHTWRNSQGDTVTRVEYDQSYFTDNGRGRGYTFFRRGIAVGVGSLYIWDKADGEADLVHGGPLPSDHWDNKINLLATPEEAEIRHEIKVVNRVELPCFGTAKLKLFYHPRVFARPDAAPWERRGEEEEAFREEAEAKPVILGGPSVFAPECAPSYEFCERWLQMFDGQWSDADRAAFVFALPMNWNVIVERKSLAIFVTAQATNDPRLFLWSRAGWLYPMLYILADQCFTWAPRDYTTWIPKNKLQEFLDSYEWTPGSIDPRVPFMYWPPPPVLNGDPALT
ncbi:hypothetical protein F4777DRAFT_582378 [Nemania sp. FL0916]|nr:hypothetical protein F4777DRAFT_582378 [Nemania sp. FL0916]